MMTDKEWDAKHSSIAELLYENGVDRHEIDHKATNYVTTNFGPRPKGKPKPFVNQAISFRLDSFCRVEPFDHSDFFVLLENDVRLLKDWFTEVVDYYDQHAEV